MSDKELLPCAHCGEPAELDSQWRYRNYATGTAIQCTRCESHMNICSGDVPDMDSEQRAAYLTEQWNRRSTASQPSVREWRPIESAPKDGSRVLIMLDGSQSIAHWQASEPHGWRTTMFVYRDEVTLWQPLPPPPGNGEGK